MPLFDAPRLIADVGSTFARCALELETGVFTHQASLSCADYPSLEAAVIAYLQTVQPLRVEHAAVAMANPVEGDQVRMTNYHWQFSIEETRLRLGLTTLVVVNDFTALAMALPRLGAQDYRQIGGGCVVQHSVKAKRLLVVGGGYIACEFASIFNGLGSKVTQLYRGEQVLRGFDDEVRHFVATEMTKSGVDLRLNTDVVDIRRTDEGLRVELEGGGVVLADAVLYATGRKPNVQGLGLDTVGVTQGAQGEVIVSDTYQTNVPGIFAVGDVTNRVQLTPVALGEAMVVVDQLFGPAAGKTERSMSYDFIPTAVFTHPNIGTVGYSEAQAREKFGHVTVFRSEFKALKHTLSGSSERTLMKLVVDTASDRVVGLHMVGAEAGEIVQGFAVAMKAGATKAVFDSTIGIHPTAAEEFVTMREPVKR